MLAGPIGSGKSTIGSILAARGAVVIEADAIGHEVLEPGGAAHGAVAARWPETVVDGHIDRSALAAIVFSDERALSVLEALTHPHIAARIIRRAEDAGDRLVVVELPLTVDILGPDWPRLVVLASEAVRMERAVERGMERRDVLRRMAVQASEEEWRATADWIVRNDGTYAELEAAVAAWWQREVEPPTA